MTWVYVVRTDKTPLRKEEIVKLKKAIANDDVLTDGITRSTELKQCGVLKYQLRNRLVNPVPITIHKQHQNLNTRLYYSNIQHHTNLISLQI